MKSSECFLARQSRLRPAVGRRCFSFFLTLAIACLVVWTAPSALAQTWHPVKVNRDANGWPHHFLVWNTARGEYEPKILLGYDSFDFGVANLSEVEQKLDRLAADNVNFVRMWLRPSDGRYAFQYNAGLRKVDVDQWNPQLFSRLDTILGIAESRGIVVEVMLWDKSTGWRGGRGFELRPPSSWQTCWALPKDPQNPCLNVNHPLNHYRSSAGNQPIPSPRHGQRLRVG